YVCGRLKDIIIVRGRNCYAYDVEHVVENASPLVRRGGVVAFEINGDRDGALAVLAEVKSRRAVPDPRDIAIAIRKELHVEAHTVALVSPHSVLKTSSGKPMRQRTKQSWLDGRLKVL